MTFFHNCVVAQFKFLDQIWRLIISEPVIVTQIGLQSNILCSDTCRDDLYMRVIRILYAGPYNKMDVDD